MTPAKHQQNWLPGIFNDFFGNEWIAKTSSAAPAINIVETEKEYEVQIAALSFMYAIHAEKVYFTIIFFFSAIIGVCFFGIITVNTPLF